MSDLLIPFGIHRETGQIIEPEDAHKGRACDCLCPGCKSPILSRHPKENRRHFAHDSKHELAKPEEECPFNSAVAVAMMVRELADSLVGKALSTPSYKTLLEFDCCSAPNNLVTISNESSVVIDEASANISAHSHHFDLKLLVGGYLLFVDLVYKGKPSITLLEPALQVVKAGVLELSCDSFSIVSLKKNRKKRFSEAVMDFVLEDGFRLWRFHPRQAAIHKAASNKHRCKSVYKPVTIRRHRHDYKPAKLSKREFQPQALESKRFHCVMCDRDWVHCFTSPLSCPGCKTHIYATEVLG